MTNDPIDPDQAREHLQMVERILAESSQRLCFGAEYFIVWGLYSGLVTAGFGCAGLGLLAIPTLIAIQIGGLVAAIAFSIWRGRTTRADDVRRSLVQREFFNVLWLTIGLAFVLNVGAFNIFHGAASAAIWSFAEAVVLFYIGMHGNRRAQIAGITVLASVIVANFMQMPSSLFVLAAGMVLGYSGFGVAELLARE